MNVDRMLNGLLKLTIAAAVLAGGAMAVLTVLDRMALDQQASERRALLARNAELDLAAMAPGSALACLDGGAGETIESACEKQVFADPQKAAAAVAYMSARLALMADAHAYAQSGALAPGDAFAGSRRAIELDRFGIAAHVLATRDGCTAERCPAFAWLRDSGVLKANLKAQAFDTYVARYEAAWNKEPEKPTPVASAPVAPPAAVAGLPEQPTGIPVPSKYDFPSAASIPPVSIMNAEPPLPKTAAPNAAAPPQAEPQADNGAPAVPVPVPPKRPQTQAVIPPPR
jgi:hypothetical protein